MDRKTTEEENLAQQVCQYLLERMDQRFTTAELAELFEVSQTRLKTSFRARYGASAHAYVRRQKMLVAARLLRESDWSVLDIAGYVGYENGSKFAQVFRRVMGASPAQYRRQNQSAVLGGFTSKAAKDLVPEHTGPGPEPGV